MTGAACDFCAAPAPRWVAPARDFDTGVVDPTVGLPTASLGGWAACDLCAAFVRSGQREKLRRHCLRALVKRLHVDGVRVTAGQMPTLEAAVGDLHDVFWQHREGAPRRMTGEELEQMSEPKPSVVGPRGDLPRRREPQWISDLHGRGPR